MNVTNVADILIASTSDCIAKFERVRPGAAKRTGGKPPKKRKVPRRGSFAQKPVSSRPPAFQKIPWFRWGDDAAERVLSKARHAWPQRATTPAWPTKLRFFPAK